MRQFNTICLMNPVFIFKNLWRYRSIIRIISIRKISERYKGTFFGFAWALIEPLMMLAVYTFVFSVIFKGNWGKVVKTGVSSTAPILFMGLITFGIFAEVILQAPTLIMQNQNFVKKVVFPLEALPVASLLQALINACFSFSVLVIGLLVIYHEIPLTIVLLPLSWIPLMVFSLGLAFFLASLGVFIRDMGSFISILVTMLRFLTPLFYPITVVPESLRPFFELNPISIFVDTSRRVVLWGMAPDWSLLGGGAVVSMMFLMCGFAWFMKTKSAFADVV